MIQPLNSPQLAAVKPRCGLQSISDLLPRLIRQYEIQAQLMQQQTRRREVGIGIPIPPTDPVEQATFAWYE